MLVDQSNIYQPTLLWPYTVGFLYRQPKSPITSLQPQSCWRIPTFSWQNKYHWLSSAISTSHWHFTPGASLRLFFFSSLHLQCWHHISSIPLVINWLPKSSNFLPSKNTKVVPYDDIFYSSGERSCLFYTPLPLPSPSPSSVTLFVLLKTNIPTELTPIWRGWHQADGSGSYVERCYRGLTVKSCYLNRVACWRRAACRLLEVRARESHSAKAAVEKKKKN